MNDPKRYYKKYPIVSPAYVVARVAGQQIKARAKKYFSGKMLDIGCGDKSKRYLVGEYVEEHIGLDHEGCLHNKTNIDLIGTAYEIPEKSETYDCVLCTAVLEHLENPQKALHEAYRVLKPGGYVIYTVPFFWHIHEAPRDFYRYTRYGLEYLFEAADFEIVEIKPLSGFWVTFGSEMNYYINSITPRYLRFISNIFIVINNIVFQFFNRIDQKIHPASDKWTWMYMVVARKPK
jgi:ubiquinone/menaquinone biosynthesis C-methylase UbiE